MYTSLEAQSAVKKALEAKNHTNHTDIKVCEWAYYRTNVNCYWQGLIKVLANDSKCLHCLKYGSVVVVNIDDILLHKPKANFGAEEIRHIGERSLEAQSAKKKASEAKYIVALRPWMKVCGVKQNNPANEAKNNTYQSSQQGFEELESKCRDTRQDNEDGANKL